MLNKKRFEALDAFRGICAIFVVIYHMHFFNSITELPFFRGSYLFVDFFFVLSGFVLAHGYFFKHSLSIRKFVISRFLRIYPLHFFMLTIFVLIEILKFHAYKNLNMNFTNIPFTGLNAVKEIIPNALLVQSWSTSYHHLSFNYPSWSISVEFYMYIILCAMIVFFKQLKLLSCFILFLLCTLFLYTESYIFTKQVLNGLSSFFLGVLVYNIYLLIENININRRIATFIEVLMLFIIVSMTSNYDSIHNFYVQMIFAFAVLLFSLEVGEVSEFLRHKSFQILGELSYSVYMTHSAVLFILISVALILNKVVGSNYAPIIDNQRYIDLGTPFMNNTLMFLSIITVVYISKFTFCYIEKSGNILYNKISSLRSALNSRS